ncbi:hypothetical protein GCM10028777_24920 [Angustibacter speluncae]
MSAHVGFTGEFQAADITAEQLERAAGEIMNALLELEETGCGIHNPAVSADLIRSVVTIEVDGEADDFEAAQALIDSCIRSAIHKVGGATPGWDLAVVRITRCEVKEPVMVPARTLELIVGRRILDPPTGLMNPLQDLLKVLAGVLLPVPQSAVHLPR